MDKNTYKIGTIIRAQYSTYVYIRSGWRMRDGYATLRVISPDKAEVIRAEICIDKRRGYVEVEQAVGRHKLISRLNDVEIVSEPVGAAV